MFVCVAERLACDVDGNAGHGVKDGLIAGHRGKGIRAQPAPHLVLGARPVVGKRQRAQAIEASLLAGRMPQWSAAACCGKAYRDDRSLDQDELDLLVTWIRQGTPEGDPATAVPVPPNVENTLPRVDVTLSIPEPYGATPIGDSSDDLRCFLLDIPEAAKGRYVTGLAVHPGNLGIVHHVAVNAIGSWGQAAFQRLDTQDDGLGWECRGGEGSLGDRQLGVWVPGLQALTLPDGLGIKLPNEGKIILNMHYDLTTVDGQTAFDQTTVDLMIADDVDHKVEALAVMNPVWVFDNGSLRATLRS